MEVQLRLFGIISIIVDVSNNRLIWTGSPPFCEKGSLVGSVNIFIYILYLYIIIFIYNIIYNYIYIYLYSSSGF